MGGCESTTSTAVVNGSDSKGRHLDQSAALSQSGHKQGITGALEDIRDQDEQEKAATKIQALYRGHRTRQQLDTKDQNNGDELSQVDLNDPELSAAATRIQASFRGHQVRRDGVLQQREEDLYKQMEQLHSGN